MIKPRIFEFIASYQKIWNEINLLENKLTSGTYMASSIDSYEEADQKLNEIQEISKKIKAKLSELESIRNEEKKYLDSLIEEHGNEYVQNMISEIIA